MGGPFFTHSDFVVSTIKGSMIRPQAEDSRKRLAVFLSEFLKIGLAFFKRGNRFDDIRPLPSVKPFFAFSSSSARLPQ